MPARLSAKIELLKEDEGTPVRQGGGAGGYLPADRVCIPPVVSAES